MEILIYKHPFNEIPKQDNPQEWGDETICICLTGGIDGEFESYDLIKTGGKHQLKIGTANSLEIAEKFASAF